MGTNAASTANEIMGVAVRTVEGKITTLDQLSNKYNSQLSVALAAISSVEMKPVLPPERLQAPDPTPPQNALGQIPNFESSALVIPDMPNMKDIDSIIGNLELPDLGPMPEAPQELALSTPQAPAIDAIYIPVKPDIDTSVSFPTVPKINDLVMPNRTPSNITIDIPAAPTINTLTMPGRPDIDVSVNLPAAPGLKEFDAPDEPSFDTSVTLPTLQPIDKLNAPQRPDVDVNIDMPADIDLVLPELEALESLKIDDFVMPDLALPDMPNANHEFEVMDFNENWWTEPAEYSDDLYDDLKHVAKDMLNNPQNFGLPDVVVKALFDKPRERISQEVERSVQEAQNTWAARGFSMPPGMLAKQVNVARQEGQLRVADLNRDIFTEASKAQIEALKFAVEKGIALEQATYNRWLDTVNRLFEVAKYNVEAAFRVYEYQFTMFNAQNEGFKILVDSYKAKLDMFTTGIRLQIESKVAQGQLNNQALEVYRAKLAGVTADGELFKTKMLAVQMRVDIIKAQFDVYRTDMQAFAEQLGAERIKLEVYDTEMRGVEAKVGIAQTQADIYAKRIQAYGGKIEGERLKLESYKAQIDGEQARLGVASTQAQIYGQDINAYTAAMGGEKLKVDLHEALLRGEQTKASIQQTEAGIYETDVRAAIALGEADKLKLSAYEAELKGQQAKLGVAEIQAKIFATETDAFKAQSDAQRIKFDAFDSQVKAEVAKAQIYDSTVRAYASRLQSYVNKGEIDVKQSQIRMDAARAYVSKYLADVDGYKAGLQASLSEVQYGTDVFRAQVDGWRAAASAQAADSEMQSRYADMKLRTNIAYAEMQMGEYAAKIQQSTQEAQLALEAAKSLGQYSAQLAAGAMSAAHVSASISGSGSASVSGSESESLSTSHNYSY